MGALLFRARAGETVSMRAAMAQRDGRRWGCVMCRALDVLIQRGHCAHALETGDGDTVGWPATRAGLLIVGVTLVAEYAVHLGFRCVGL